MIIKKEEALNIGCCDIHLDHHLNVDIDPNNQPELLQDATKIDQSIEPGTVRSIYAGHLLEHLTPEQGGAFLLACKNVLAPHGVLTVVVPDWRKVAQCEDFAEGQADDVIFGRGQHVRLMDASVLKDMLKKVFPEVHVVDAADIGYIIHRGDKLQTAAIAINRPVCQWRYVQRLDEPANTAAWKNQQNAAVPPLMPMQGGTAVPDGSV
jgi:predicted SAM-dependent methyltransferase